MEKTFSFRVKASSIGCGCVTANTVEEAIEKIKKDDWDDIYDTINTEYGEIISIEED